MIDTNKLSENEIARAKRASEPGGLEAAKFPLMFAASLLFGNKQSREVSNGTASLVNLGGQPTVVTAYHVIQEYRKRLNNGEDLFFLVGNLLINNPLERLTAESKQYDLATFKIEPKEVTGIRLQPEEIGSRVYEPRAWPPEIPEEGKWVVFGGFPGKGRIIRSWNDIDFYTFSHGATEVTSVSEDHFVCQFQRENWVIHNPHKLDDLSDLGGLSGCPVFLIKTQLITYFELVGFVTEFSPSFDLLYVTHAKHIKEDGSIPPDERTV